MKILVSGVTGFLGSHVFRHLSKRYEVSGVSHSKPDPGQNIFSISDLNQKNFDAVIHCHAAVASGGETPESSVLFEGNVIATQRLLKLFPDSKHLYISTVSVYAQSESTITESSPLNPATPYAVSKLWGECLVKATDSSCIIRFPSLFGPGMKLNTLIPVYVGQALNNGEIKVWGDGSRTQNYLFIDDAVALIESALTSSEHVVLGTNSREYSNHDIAQIIAAFTNASITFTGNDTTPSAHYDNTLTRKALNWQPQSGLDEALRQYIEWRKRQ